MSDTPRTDRVAITTFKRDDGTWGFRFDEDGPYVSSGYSRTLETELIAANAEIERLKNKLKERKKCHRTALETASVISKQLDATLEELEDTKGRYRTESEHRHEVIRLLDKSESELTSLETELVAALARIAELGKENSAIRWENDRMNSQIKHFQKQLSESQAIASGLQRTLSAVETKLSESQAQLAEVKGQYQTEAKHRHECIRLLNNAEAQLASAREDSVRLDWLENIQPAISCHGILGVETWSIWNGGKAPSVIGIIEAHSLRSAIDSARGVTSPIAVAETGEKAAWQPIETAPKDGTKFVGLYGELVFTTWWQAHNVFGPMKPGGGHDVVGQAYAWSHAESHSINGGTPTKWQPLPPPPQGKETRE